MDRSFFEVIVYSGPFAVLLLLASVLSTGAFVFRAFVRVTPDNSAYRHLTDAILFCSVVALMTFLLLHNVAQAIYGLAIKGIDADRPLAVAVENVFVYASIGSALIASMVITQIVRKK